MKKTYFFGLSLILAVVSLSAGTAFARPYKMFRVNSVISQPLTIDRHSMAVGKVIRYYGGPVISHAKVHVIFWGQGVSHQVQSQIGPFYANILNSGYMDMLSQYGTNVTTVDGKPGTGQKISRGSYEGSVTIIPFNAGKTVSDSMIRQELTAQIAAGHLAQPDADTLYMIYFPAGVKITEEDGVLCQEDYAYHDGFNFDTGASIFYGVMADCGFGFKKLSVVSSHEMVEAITDPFPTPGRNPSYPQAWNTSSGDEVVDLCDAKGSSFVKGAGGLVSAVEPVFDNSVGACDMGPWSTGGAWQSVAALLPRSFTTHFNPTSMAVVAHLGSPILWDSR